MRIIPLLILLSFFGNSYSQTCLQKLDSVNKFKYSEPERARFHATSLLEDLDSGKCLAALGTEALYNNLGLILWEINDKFIALEALLRGVESELSKGEESSPSLLGLFYNLSTFYREMGNFSKADEYLLKVEKIIDLHYHDDIKQKIAFLHNKGFYNREKGDFASSKAALIEAIGLIKDEKDSTKIALYIDLGTTYRHFGDYAMSETTLLKAIKLSENHQELLFFKAVDRLSALKIEQGEFSDSEKYLLRNLERKQEKFSDNTDIKIETYNNLCILYYRLNDLESAQKFINIGLEENQNSRILKPKLLNNLGTIFMRRGQLKEAKKYFAQSAKEFQEIYGSINPDYVTSLSNLAGIYKLNGELETALGLYSKVLDMDKAIFGSNHPTYATSLNNVGLLYMQLNNMRLAGQLLEKAKTIRLKSLGKYHPLTVKSTNDLALYYLVNRDTLSAIKEFDKSLGAEIHHMKDIFPVLTDNQRKLYFIETRANINRYCALVFQPNFINTEYAVHAVNHFLNTKGMLFYASEKMRNVILSSGNEKIIKTYNDWKDEKYTLAQAYLLTKEERTRQSLDVVKMEEKCIKLEKQLAQTFDVFLDEGERNKVNSWTDISKSLQKGSAVVDIIQFKNFRVSIKDRHLEQSFEDKTQYVAFIIKPDSTVEKVLWDNKVDLNRSHVFYKNAIKFGIEDTKSYKIFWSDIQEKLQGINRVYLSPDGVFHKMNVSVLYNVETGKYVADELDISNISSGKDIIHRSKKPLVKNAAIFGNPNFSNIKTDYMALAQLPGAEEEAKNISKILNVKKWKVKSYYFDEATEGAIKSTISPGLMHIATHGYFEETTGDMNPLYSSGLFMSKDLTSNNDGILSAYEAMNLQLDNTSLVVLAACETGLGTVQNGEGVFGLQRAFLVAGAKNLLISLVKINDQSARRFMNIFYEQLKLKEDPQEAFFETRRLYRKENPTPYNWGAYLLVSKG